MTSLTSILPRSPWRLTLVLTLIESDDGVGTHQRTNGESSRWPFPQRSRSHAHWNRNDGGCRCGYRDVAACGSDKSTGPAPLGQPVVTQVNGVSEPVGLIGMTVILEGSSLGDSARGKVYFLGSSGVKIQAPASVCDYAASGPRTAYTDR
jgi:hypothetical protein